MALILDGATQYIRVADANSLSFGDGANDEPFSITAWINLVDATESIIISKRSDFGAPNQWEWQLAFDQNDKLDITCFDRSATTLIQTKSNGAFTGDQGTWIFVTGTYDGSELDTGLTLYRNAVAIASTDATNPPYTAMENTNTPVDIGMYTDGAGNPANFFDGTLFDVRVYASLLSLAEIKSIYYAQGSDNLVDNLVGRWLMNEKPDGLTAAGANAVIDISGNGNHGTPANEPVYRAASVKLVRPII